MFVLIKLSITWIIVLNAVGWLSIQMGLAWDFTKMPVDWYNPGRTRFWERSGPFNEVVFRIEDWKVWFGGGSAKRALAEKNRHYLQRFIRETWRGELCPRMSMLCAPVFFLWKPQWCDWNILACTLAANLPCILVHRYKRARFQRLLLRGSRRRVD